MSPAKPLAPSIWPMFVFTDPISRGLSLGRDALIVAAIAEASRGSPAAVPEMSLCQYLKLTLYLMIPLPVP